MKNSMTKTTLKFIFLVFVLSGTFTVNAQERFGGLALYTVRDDMTTNAKATLLAVAEAGYKNIEAAGYKDGKFYNMTPADFKKLLQEFGLNPISTHQGSVTMENADAMIADVKAAGFKYFVIPVPPMGLFNFDRETRTMSMTGGAANLAEIVTALGKKCQAAGLELLYHNHDFEFQKDYLSSLKKNLDLYG